MDRILIKNGRVIDPYIKRDEIGNIYIENGKIVEGGHSFSPDLVIDAKNNLVVPGLIDYHAHVFQQGTDAGVPPDLAMLPNGITTVVDGGSSGTANYESFYTNIVGHSVIRVKAFIALSCDGQISIKKNDNYDPQYCDDMKLKYLMNKYKDNILGIKLKQTKNNINDKGLKPIKKALSLAKQLGCRINVHAIDPPCSTKELIQYFRKGDIFTHVYHGIGSTILGENGHIIPEVWEAKKRGVVFDACNGKNNFDMQVAKKAIREKFYPDIISSDLTMITLYKQPVIALPWIMSKYLALGMRLYDVIAAVTSTPAKYMEMNDEIGTLKIGACADVAIFKQIEGEFTFFDKNNNAIKGKCILLPQLTVKEGMVVYKELTAQLY